MTEHEQQIQIKYLEASVKQIAQKYEEIRTTGTELCRANATALKELDHLISELDKKVQRNHDKYNTKFDEGVSRMTDIEKAAIMQKNEIVSDLQKSIEHNWARTRNMFGLIGGLIVIIQIARWMFP